MAAKPLYYPDYVHLDKLLTAQTPQSGTEDAPPAHDEMLFIITHQTYELWFKQILHELDSIMTILAGQYLDDKHTPCVVARLERIGVILKVLLQQVDILETMTPMDFLEFRDALMPASGFQSYQFRILENKLGCPHDEQSPYLNRLQPAEREKVTASMQSSSLFDLVAQWLERMPFMEHKDYSLWQSYHDAVQALFARDSAVLQANPLLTEEQRQQQSAKLDAASQRFEHLLDEQAYAELLSKGGRRLSYKASCAALFILLYRDYPVFQLPFKLLSALVDIDDLLTNWRYRHFNLAMRMIGPKVGTGGSAGAEYLRSTIHQRIFDDITSLTVFMVSRSDLPPLPDEYGQLLGFHYAESSQ